MRWKLLSVLLLGLLLLSSFSPASANKALYNGEIIGSAHYEDRDHDVISFEQAEEKISLYYYSPWVITPDHYYLYNYISSPYNDGYATKIRKW